LEEDLKKELGIMEHSSVTATSSDIGVTDSSALDLARTYGF
tara:strand:+ start:356 stop:478 length:123 start_codon:yes stop_codon:yes gene_type:complete